MKKEVVIIGGGLAGLTAGIQLSRNGISVMIIEKNDFPKHKVCGEYVSNEIKSYLEFLDVPFKEANPSSIDHFEFSTLIGKSVTQPLPLGGFGISRYTLDFLLYKKALSNGCTILKDKVENCSFDNEVFTIETAQKKTIHATVVLGAFGKKANLDYKMDRQFIHKEAPWLAVKNHYTGVFKKNMVGLYHFKGGYCGVSKIENDVINICYITNFISFKKYKNIATFQEEVLFKNEKLKTILQSCTPVFEKPLTISQFSFDDKEAVSNHVLMIGDAAGLIHPLCGNGMAMAIHSAKIASELTTDFLSNCVTNRLVFEQEYTSRWNATFKQRLQFGKWLSKILEKPIITLIVLQILQVFPFLLQQIIKQTHGKPIA
jgi:menaquinone-9 beta-reductase